MEPKLHPAVTVSNIKNFITITLDLESGQFTSWSELFKIHCKAFLVYDHLLHNEPPTATTSSSKEPSKPDAPKPNTPSTLDSWERLDSIVLQWIYDTISYDLLNTIIKTNTTAHEAWTTLGDLFRDNKASWAIYLKTKLANTRLDNVPNMHAYYQELKLLSDQLANVDAPLTDADLVLQLIMGLNEQYEGIAMVIQNTEPLPSFYKARSSVIKEEIRKNPCAAAAAKASGTALHTATGRPEPKPTPEYSRSEYNRSEYGRTDNMADRRCVRGRSRGRGQGGRQSWGRGRYGFQDPDPYPSMQQQR
ncbi:uncharacterized protein LOC143631249 [Bidens hawaiensis]|uniref:uncharacterized protein LOC143631249 n=1 Tax=Bidens hawaiensis TaxID=980011 RepID=UPI00404999C2